MTAPADWWKDFFAGLAVAFWDAAVPEKATAEDAAFLWKHLGLRRGASVLDVPCGSGRLTRPLARAALGALLIPGVRERLRELSEEFRSAGAAGTA